MESIYPELALWGNKTECARTNIVFLPISEVSEGIVFLVTVSWNSVVTVYSTIIYSTEHGLSSVEKWNKAWPLREILKTSSKQNANVY